MWKMPEITDWAKAQNAHEPTRAYGEEIFEIARDFYPITIKKEYHALEIGAAWGVSTMAMLMGLTQDRFGISQKIFHLTSVDSDKTVKAPQEVAASGFNDQWTFVNKTSAEFWEENTVTFDLIYVDGSHLYKDVKNDLFRAWDALESGGWLFLDDFTHPKNIKADPENGEAEYGVSLAVWELIKEKGIKHIETTTRLLILIK